VRLQHAQRDRPDSGPASAGPPSAGPLSPTPVLPTPARPSMAAPAYTPPSHMATVSASLPVASSSYTQSPPYPPTYTPSAFSSSVPTTAAPPYPAGPRSSLSAFSPPPFTSLATAGIPVPPPARLPSPPSMPAPASPSGSPGPERSRASASPLQRRALVRSRSPRRLASRRTDEDSGELFIPACTFCFPYRIVTAQVLGAILSTLTSILRNHSFSDCFAAALLCCFCSINSMHLKQ
jgi:hypothetical protein